MTKEILCGRLPTIPELPFKKMKKKVMKLGHLSRQETSTELDKGIVLRFLSKLFRK